MPAPITFYFDFISPYAYVAWSQIHRLAGAHAVRPVPVLFAALLDHHGQRGPAEIPAKRAYIFKDVWRKAHRFGLPPVVPPPAHPFNPLTALRVTALLDGKAEQRAAIDALFRATWAGGGGVDGPARVAEVLTGIDLDGPRLVAEANEPDAKARVRANTEAAIADGAFGVPTMIVNGELFWGVDALEALADHLAGKDPLPRDLLARWKDLPATATRPGSTRS